MEVSATTKYVRMSPTKARDLANEIKGLSVSDALRVTEFNARKAAVQIGKTLKSAIANAENNEGLAVESLFVKNAIVDGGPMMKRFRPRARGMASPIQKKTSHITVILSDKA
jgi:large subunit ribosomal protein L22